MAQNEEISCSPRTCNTGALNTSESGLRACVDWVSFTLKSVPSLHDICDILGLDFNLFDDCDFGDKGYLNQLRFGHIQILYNGRENMGIHVNMSGQGCREFEQYSHLNWSKLFILLLEFKAHFSRLDIAIDDFEKYLSIKTMKRKLKEGCVRSKFRTAREMRKTYIADGSSRGDTIYFGSPQSRIQVRFYDKLLERLEAGKQIEEDVTHWVRAEVQMRDERAETAAFIIAHEFHTVGVLAKGILSNYMAFVDKDNNKNKSRWKLSKFWIKFLGDVEKIPLSQVAPDRTIERSYDWIDKQVTTTFAMLYEAFGHDPDFIESMLDDGYSKLRVEHVDILNRFKRENNNSTVMFRDFQAKRAKEYKSREELKKKKKESSWNEDSNVYEI